MKILFLANHLNVGGISSYLFTLAKGLKLKGHEVYLASSGGQLCDKFTKAGVVHLDVPLNTKNEISPKILLSFLKLKRQLKENKIDLIHSHSRTTQVLGALLSRSWSTPHIFTCHGFFKPRLSRRIFPCWGQAVIAISQEVAEHLEKDFNLAPDKISVINNGIDLLSFGDFSLRTKVRNSLGVGDYPLIGIIARLSDVKGHLYLLRALAKIIPSCPNVKLLIVGTGKMKVKLVAEAKFLGINQNIIFQDEASNTQEILSALDVFVMPSLQEGLGLALMEAMAQGLAVVGSSVGGIKTLIQDSHNGYLVTPADTDSLSQAILKLLLNPALRQELGKNARQFILENFSQEKMVSQTEKIYFANRNKL